MCRWSETQQIWWDGETSNDYASVGSGLFRYAISKTNYIKKNIYCKCAQMKVSTVSIAKLENGTYTLCSSSNISIASHTSHISKTSDFNSFPYAAASDFARSGQRCLIFKDLSENM